MPFSPYSKEQQLGYNKAKKPKKKKKHTYKGRVVPTKKQRTKITKKDYNKMIEEFGSMCSVCGRTQIEAHHIVFRSQFGSGNWRNLTPLCNKHHQLVHKDRNLAEWFRTKRKERFGEHYWKDRFTLFREELIPNTTTDSFEKFMKGEEERARDI
jgi:5-methylcytosine-specific restriction endonuclease McrA